MRKLVVFSLSVGLLLGCGCSAGSKEGKEPEEAPKRVKVAHVLVAFRGAEGFKGGRTMTPQALKRSREQAETLAQTVLTQAKTGGPFDTLVGRNSDDRTGTFPNGPYVMFDGVPVTEPGGFPREQMAKGFGDVAFSLKVGEVGMASYHPTDSPFGWHIIKRLE